jgi:hypothetical protein
MHVWDPAADPVMTVTLTVATALGETQRVTVELERSPHHLARRSFRQRIRAWHIVGSCRGVWGPGHLNHGWERVWFNELRGDGAEMRWITSHMYQPYEALEALATILGSSNELGYIDKDGTLLPPVNVRRVQVAPLDPDDRALVSWQEEVIRILR